MNNYILYKIIEVDKENPEIITKTRRLFNIFFCVLRKGLRKTFTGRGK